MLHILLSIFLFVYPWQQQQQQEQPLHSEHYSYTGNFYSSYGYSSKGARMTIYVQIFKSKLIATFIDPNSGQGFDKTYTYNRTDEQNIRYYYSDEKDYFRVDTNYDIEQVLGSSTYNGHAIEYTTYELIHGDYSKENIEYYRHQLYDNPMGPFTPDFQY